MMRLRFLVPVLGLSSLCAFACSGSGSDEGGEGGAGGEGEPVATPGGEGGGAGHGGGGCMEGGVGKLTIEVRGLPEDVAPDLLIDGPDSLAPTDSEITFDDVASGDYSVTASQVFDADPLVRTVYEATVETESFCLADGDQQTVKVTYAAIPTSNKLWMASGLMAEGAAFSSSAIADSGITDASVSIDGGIGKAIAFDRDGNLWTLGPTLDFPMVLRFPAEDLGESGKPMPDVSFSLPEVACLPALKSLAFDAAGNLWVSACQGEVLRIPAGSLSGVDADKEADVVLAGLDDNRGLAFDADGNLWVGTALGLARYDVARLDSPSGEPPDLLLAVADDTAPLRPFFLAFDQEGDLWSTDFDGNAVFRVAAEELTGVGEAEVQAAVSISIAVSALLNQPAFDEGGGLWLGLDVDPELDGAGALGRLSPSQLTVSAGPGSPVTPSVIVNSASIGAQLPLAFFPAPPGLPLYHALPVE